MKRYLHVYSLTVADIDASRRMTAGAVLCYFQDTIGRFLSEARVSAIDLLEEGRTWMILEFHASLFREMSAWPGIVQVEVFLSEITSLKAYVDYLFRDVRGDIVARGTSIWVMIDLGTRRPVPCSEVQRFVEQYDPHNRVPHLRYHFPDDGQPEGAVATGHRVTRLETDFNGHMSNRDFVRLALSVIDPAATEGRTIREIHARFQQECLAGETLDCVCAAGKDGRITIRIAKPDGTAACLVYTVWI